MKVVFILFLCCSASAIAGWTGQVLPDHRVSPGRAVIVFLPQQESGAPTFEGALEALARQGHLQRLELITLHRLVDDPDFQKEIFSALKQLAPTELANARRSAGNIHNPKMIPLRKPFEQAVLATPTVRSINSHLQKSGLRISGVSHEKLSLVGDKVNPRLSCMMWLAVTSDK